MTIPSLVTRTKRTVDGLTGVIGNERAVVAGCAETQKHSCDDRRHFDVSLLLEVEAGKTC